MSKAFKLTSKAVTRTVVNKETITSLSQIKPRIVQRNVLIPFERNVSLLDEFLEDEARENQLAAMPNLRIKRYYIHKLHGSRLEDYTFYRKIPKQALKCMTRIHVTGDANKNIINILKSARCLRKIKLEPRNFHGPCKLLKYAENRVSDIDLRGVFQNAKEDDICKLYRILGYFHELKILRLNLSFTFKNKRMWMDERQDKFDIEKDLMHRYLQRLHNLQELTVLHWDRSRSLGRLLKKREPQQQCPIVTSLDFAFRHEMFPAILYYDEISKCEVITTYDPVKDLKRLEAWSKPEVEFLWDFVKRGENDDDVYEEEKKNSNDPKPEKSLLDRMRKRLIYNVDFGFFPNLRVLRLYFSERYEVENTSFVLGGFATLKNLERMSLEFHIRPNGTRFIFEGILNLPFLTHFCLKIPFIRDEEWNLFAQFIQKQHNLTSLSLEITQSDVNNAPQYREMSIGLGNALQALENTPKLEHLSLHFYNCLFTKFAQECLSKGLEQASNGVKSLKSFSFDGVLLPIGYGSTSSNHLEGFNKFLQQQKRTLTSLEITLDFLIDAGAAVLIQSIIPDLQELKFLEFKTNTFGYRGVLMPRLECLSWGILKNNNNFKEITRIQDSSWNSLAAHFSTILASLPKLQELDLAFEKSDFTFRARTSSCLIKYDEIYFKIIEKLPELKALRKLRIGIPIELFGELWKEQVLQLLLGLKHVNRIDVDLLELEKFCRTCDINLPCGYIEVAKDIDVENARKFTQVLFQELRE